MITKDIFIVQTDTGGHTGNGNKQLIVSAHDNQSTDVKKQTFNVTGGV